MSKLLEIHNLKVISENKEILKDITLEIAKGEVVYLMGKNGAGKSTVAKTIMGHPYYEVNSGTLLFEGKNMNKLETNERSKLGIFLANQYPVEVPGVNLFNFLRIAYNSKLPKDKGLNVFKFRKYIEPILANLNIDKEFLNRNLNEGFSGGEKKKCEILQMAVLNPKLVILDETDSGLDVDSLKEVFNGIKKIKKMNPEMGILIITHYNRVLDYLDADKVYIIKNGTIVKSGGSDIVKEIEEKGYQDQV